MMHSLEWPSLTVEWIPSIEEWAEGILFDTYRHAEEGYSVQELYLATHTSDGYPNAILKASIRLQSNETESGMKDCLDAHKGFWFRDLWFLEFTTEGISGKLTIHQRILHDGDVNKL